MPGEMGRISWGIYYVAYIFMDLRSVYRTEASRRATALWLGEMKEEKEGEVEEEEEEEKEEEEEEEEEKQEKGTGDEVAIFFEDQEGEEGEEDEEKESELKHTQRKEAAHRCSKLAAGTKQL
jgi:hypothetical protein